ncbi:hypothetical protein K8I31_13180, partial [bacterium]|nr:hypothetical protein [bacterium]
LTLHGTGSATSVGGANGGGEAALVPVAPAPGVQAATASVSIEEFLFEDAALSYPYSLTAIPKPCLIQFQSMAPIIHLEWSMQTPPEAKAPAVGSVLRVDLMAEHGNRIQSLIFDLKFDHQALRFLGMTPGDAWEQRIPLRTQFATPSLANQAGEMSSQEIHALESGACRDERASLLTMFFAVQEPGEAAIQFQQFSTMDEKGRELKTEMNSKELSWSIASQSPALRP